MLNISIEEVKKQDNSNGKKLDVEKAREAENLNED